MRPNFAYNLMSVLVVSSLASACAGPNARILTHTKTIEAEILRRESDQLIVLVDAESQDPARTPQQQTIPLSDIREIQHPGDDEATTSAIITGAGLGGVGLGALLMVSAEGIKNIELFITGGLIFTISSVVALVGGVSWLTHFIIYKSSKDAAEDDALISVHFTPIVGLQEAGVGVALRW